MSRSIENYGIQMEFDNKDFEKGVEQTLGTLDRLKKQLNFDGASKGLEDLGYAAKKVNFNPLSNAVGSVQNGFSALETIATGALLKIGSRVEELGEKLLKTATAMSALNPTNILSGWEKFGDKTISVGTLVSQGNDIDHVNEQLDKLRWYTDETSYAFTDMVSNIAKFTAAGQDFDSSVIALEGFANWAAMAGQNAQTASRAMYQLSQAMGKGVMKLDDWKSIQNASMDTDEFRQIALDTAVAMGRLRENANGTYTSLVGDTDDFTKAQFSASLTEGLWFDADVMMTVYEKYAKAVDPIYEYAQEFGVTASEAIEELAKEGAIDDFAIRAFKAAQEARTLKDAIDSVKEAVQSGWSEIFETIFGDYEEAKDLWTNLANQLYDIFAGGFGGINDLLKGGLSSGFKQFIDLGIPRADEFKETLIYVARDSGVAIDDLIKESGSLAKSFKEGWLTSEMLIKSVDTMAETYSNLTEEQREEQGITQFRIDKLKELNQALKEGKIDANEWAEAISSTSGREYLTKSLFNIIDVFFSYEEVVDEMGNTTQQATGIISIFKEALANIFPPMTSERIFGMAKRVEEFTRSLRLSEDQATKLQKTLEGVFSIFKTLKNILVQVIKYGFKQLDSVVKSLNIDLKIDFLGVLASIGSKLTEISKWLETNNPFEIGVSKVIELIDLLKAKFDALWGSVKNSEIVQSVIDKLSPVFENIRTTFDTMIAGLDENSTLGRIINGLSENLQKLGDIKSWTPKTLIETLTSLVQSAFEGFTNLNSLWSAMDTGATAMISGIGNAAEGTGIQLQKAGSSIVGFFGSVVDAVRENVNIVQILTVASGVALLKYIKAVSDLISSVNILGKFGSVFTGLKHRFQSEAMLNAAKALAILAGVIAGFTLLAKTHVKELWISVRALAAITAIFAGLVFLNSKINSAPLFEIGKFSVNISPFIFALVGFIASIKMLVDSFKTLHSMNLNVGEFVGLLGQLALITTFVIALYELTLWINKKAKISAATAKDLFAIVGLVVALRVAVYALKSLSDIAKSLDGHSVLNIILLLIPVVLSIIAVQKLSSGMRVGAGVGLLLSVGSIFALVLILEHLAKQPIGEISAALPQFIDIMKYVALLLAASSFAGRHGVGAGVMIAGIGASLLLIIRAIKNLTEIEIEDLRKVKDTIFDLLGVFGLLLIASQFSGENAMKAGVMFIMMSGTLLILTGVLLILQAIPKPDLEKATVAIGSLMLIFGAIIFASAYTETAYKSIMAISSTILILGFMIAALAYFAKDDLGALNESIKTLAILLLSLAGVFIAFGFINKESEKLDMDAVAKTFLGLSFVIFSLLLVMSAVAILNAIPIEEGLIEKAIVLAGLLAVCTGITLLLSKFGQAVDAGAVLQGAFAIAEFVFLMEVFLGLIGALTMRVNTSLGGDGKTIEHVLDESIIIMTKIGEAIGRFVGAIVEGFVDEAVFKQIENLATHLVNFSDIMVGFNTASVDAAKSAIGLFLMFVGADFLSGLEAVGNLILEGITAGYVGKNKNKLTDFFEMLPKLGEALKNFGDALGPSFKPDAVKTAADSFRSLIEAFRRIPNEGGLASWFAGENDLDTFLKADKDGKTVLTRLADALISFQDALPESVDTDKIKSATTALGYITDFAKSIPNEGGLLGDIFGENDMDVFAGYLPSLAEGIAGFANGLDGVTLDGLDKKAKEVSEVGKTLTEMAGSIFNLGGKLYEPLIQNDDYVAYSATEALDFLHKFLLKMPEIGIYMSRFSDNMSGVDTALLQTVSIEFQKWINFAKDIIGIDLTSLPKFTEVLTNTAEEGINGFLTKVSENFQAVYEKARAFIQYAIEGINDKQLDVETAINGLADTMVLTLGSEANVEKFRQAGSYAVQGFIDGIESRIDDVREAAERLSEAAEEASSESLEIGSPSKIFEILGEFTGEGFANGLSNMADTVKSKATTLGESAVEGIKNGVSGLKDVLANNTNINVDGLVGTVKDKVSGIKQLIYDKTGLSDLDLNSMFGINFNAADYMNGITPVVDLDALTSEMQFANLEAEVGNLDSLMSFWQASGINDAMKEQEELASQIQNGSGEFGNVYTFTQNNYSPKALSREEIYRQTRNQFALMKGTVK